MSKPRSAISPIGCRACCSPSAAAMLVANWARANPRESFPTTARRPALLGLGAVRAVRPSRRSRAIPCELGDSSSRGRPQHPPGVDCAVLSGDSGGIAREGRQLSRRRPARSMRRPGCCGVRHLLDPRRALVGLLRYFGCRDRNVRSAGSSPSSRSRDYGRATHAARARSRALARRISLDQSLPASAWHCARSASQPSAPRSSIVLMFFS